nr:uncharacterized protein LOC102588634 isoform X3 [Ipomoea trifida]
MILQWLRTIPQQLNPEVDISGSWIVVMQYTEWLVDNGIIKPVHYNEILAPSVGIGSMSMARKPIESSTKIDSSLGFSLVHFVKGPRIGLTAEGSGIIKVKVSQVKETDQFIAVTTGDTYTMGITLQILGENNAAILIGSHSGLIESSLDNGQILNRTVEFTAKIGQSSVKRSEAQSVKVITELNAYRLTNASKITGSDKAVPKKDKDCY